jgi:hypothetical protein
MKMLAIRWLQIAESCQLNPNILPRHRHRHANGFLGDGDDIFRGPILRSIFGFMAGRTELGDQRLSYKHDLQCVRDVAVGEDVIRAIICFTL